jgi:Cu(I)/Ag(I) efflux system membrane fusion protein
MGSPMKKLTRLVPILLLILGAFIAGSWITWSASGRGQPQGSRKVLYWVDPMHPSYKSDKPGTAPDCGMLLEPVYADAAAAGAASPVAGALRVSDEKRQLIGVRVGLVETHAIQRVIRTVGRIAVDENRLYRLVAASEGIVKRMSAFSAGSLVRKHELLLVYFARDYLRPQQVYFVALDYLGSATSGGATADRLTQARGQLRLAIDDLLSFGMDEIQIADLARTRKLTPDIELRSPVTGFVMARNVSPEQRFDRGVELYRIADLGSVWILVDVFENESRDLKPGTQVRVTPSYAGARPFVTRVSDVLPQFDPDTRTIKIRLDAPNPDYGLRPGMFVDAEIPVSLPGAITVPLDAVVDSGLQKTVFVDRGNGYFEPRHVETGWRFDDRVQIVNGLAAGERIVLSGTFLLDSEARMKAASAGITTAEKDPICGMDVDQARAKADGKTTTYKGSTFYFCSDQCKKTFDSNPAKYGTGQAPPPAENQPPDAGPLAALKPLRVQGLEGEPATTATPVAWSRPPVVGMAGGLSAIEAVQLTDGKKPSVVVDPACGTVVLTEEAVKGGLMSEYLGITRYFSSKACKESFDREPGKFVVKG